MVKNSSALRKYLLLLFGVTVHLSFAQNSISSNTFSGLSAFEDFQERKYESVISDLENKQTKSDDEEILLFLSELKTGKGEPSPIEDWLSKNPKHPIRPLVSYHLGEYYYYAHDTLNSKKYLSKVSVKDLTLNDQASYGYVYGLLILDDGNYKDAKNLLIHARKSGFEDSDQLNYYEAYASYHLGQNDQALEKFESVQKSENFGTSAKFFIAKMRIENGEADEVIAMTQSELSEQRTKTNSGLYQLVGEAYAQKNLVNKADAFFQRAIELHPSKPSAALYYQAGVSKFKIGNEDLAIDFLTKAGIQGGEYAQLSAYQLGRLYLKKADYENALTAYTEASGSDDKQIQEESYYQIANINAELGQFAQAITYSIDYLNRFPNSERTVDLQNLIAQSYLSTSNYDLAIEHLNEIGITSSTQRDVYQKVTYQKATLAFNDADFNEANRWFRECLKYATDVSIKNGSHYHLAEIAMRGNRYNEAIIQYQNQTLIDPVSHYGIGYAYYNTQQYQKAIDHFRNARNASEVEISNDASVRLADCLYATKSYQQAYAIYNDLSSQISSDYLTFQKGITLKNMERYDAAITEFQRIFSSPRYAANAKFQSGMIQFESANFGPAESYFTQVINQHTNSDNVVESLLNRGIARKNLGKLESAGEDYKLILDNHISHEIAINAILGLQELQQAGISIDELDTYIDQYRKANPKSGSLELIEFESAKRLYFDFAYSEAAQAFDKYLKDYPASSNASEAKYYQADSYYRIDELENAKPLFDELKLIRSALTGRILNRLGDINSRLENWEEAESTYNLLTDLNLTPKDSYNARQGLMKLYYKTEQFDKAIASANQIQMASWKPLKAGEEAELVKARSWQQMNQLDSARNSFSKLAQNVDAIGAEANYQLGLIAYESAQHESSLELLFELNANYGSYLEWVDQSYLLIAKNYIAMDQLFQAKATLRSIIQHSKNEQIINESQLLLNEIEQDSKRSDSTQIKD